MINKNRWRGFTLLEIMIALAIFSVASASFYLQSVSILKATSRVEEKYIAEIIAENSLEKYFIDRSWPPFEEEKIIVNMYGREWYVTITISDSEVKDIKSIEASVYSSDDKNDNSLIRLSRLIGKN